MGWNTAFSSVADGASGRLWPGSNGVIGHGRKAVSRRKTGTARRLGQRLWGNLTRRGGDAKAACGSDSDKGNHIGINLCTLCVNVGLVIDITGMTIVVVIPGAAVAGGVSAHVRATQIHLKRENTGGPVLSATERSATACNDRQHQVHYHIDRRDSREDKRASDHPSTPRPNPHAGRVRARRSRCAARCPSVL